MPDNYFARYLPFLIHILLAWRDCDCHYLAFLADRGAETDSRQDVCL